MHVPDFKQQPLSMQAHLICRHGVYLSERSDGHLLVALYSLFDFYVEVYYHLATGEVAMITSFRSVNLLAPYLDKIDLRPLLQPALY